MKRLAVLLALSLATLTTLAAAPAVAAPSWNLELHHNPTNFPPGGTAQYWLDLDNVGSSASSAPIELTVELPAGLTSAKVISGQEFRSLAHLNWSCTGETGATEVKCETTSGSIPRHTLAHLILEVKVASGSPEGTSVTATATLQGGGAPAVASDFEPATISSAPAGFGILESSFRPDFFASDGLTAEREAGAHPALLTVPVDFNSVSAPVPGKPTLNLEAGSLRDLSVDLPPGFIGNPTAVGECTAAEYTVGACPPSSQLGRFDGSVYPPGAGLVYNFSTGVFNMVHPRGALTDLGFNVNGNPVHVKVSLDPADHYAITTKLADVNETLPPFSGKVTTWGIPAESTHDSERCGGFNAVGTSGDTSLECPTDHERRPYISLPSQCESDNVFRAREYDSWQEKGAFGPELDYTMPGHLTACDRPRFEPEVEIEPTGHQANTPTGLDLHVKIAQNENPNALATPPVRRFTVTLPQGMSFSPSFADGLQSCTLAQIKLETNESIECPDASRIGEVALHTPLLPRAAEGSMYLAAQGDNPFGSLFALYLVLHDTEERGALIKIPGRVEVDETTGQITTVFNDTPQFPFDDLTLKFRSGSRAPLVNPPSCGSHEIGVEVASYAQPNDPVDASNTYQITEGPNGTPCPPDSARRPFHPDFSGGTLNPVAGSYSTFLFRLSREDDEQELSQVTTILPPGLLAKIAGVPFCPDAALASISTELGAGAAEQANPSCPAASQIGTISAGLGAGPGPNYFPGKVYLAGPYKGAPLSLAIVVPGLAGPFDLGNSVIRTALRVDPDTSRVTAVSDPFPTILHGVILRVRDVRLRLDRPETTLNPTNCSPTSLNADITGVGGDLFSTADDSLFQASDRFQVGDCGRLGFKPQIFFKLKGGTHRGDHPALKAVLTYPPGQGYANTRFAQVALPHSEFLAQEHIRTVCTRVQFEAGNGNGEQCPAGSIYGKASAVTPLLEEPLTGPVYLRSSSNKLPDLVVALQGPASQPIAVDLDGRIDSKNGGIRTTFEAVPDAPVSKFTLEMQGGKKGLIVNSRNLCTGSQGRVTADFIGQNNKRHDERPVLQNECGKHKAKKGKQAHKRHAEKRASLSSAVVWTRRLF